MSNNSLHQQRNAIRYIIEDNVCLTRKDGREEDLLLSDYSAAGICVKGGSPLLEGERIKALIRLPFFFNAPAEKEAEVIWSKEINDGLWLSGLKFQV